MYLSKKWVGATVATMALMGLVLTGCGNEGGNADDSDPSHTSTRSTTRSTDHPIEDAVSDIEDTVSDIVSDFTR